MLSEILMHWQYVVVSIILIYKSLLFSPVSGTTCKIKEFKGIQVHDRHPFSDLTNRAGINASACSKYCCETLQCVAFFHTTNQLVDAGNCKQNEPCCWLKPSFNESRLDDFCQDKDACISGVCEHSEAPHVTISNVEPRRDTAGNEREKYYTDSSDQKYFARCLPQGKTVQES